MGFHGEGEPDLPHDLPVIIAIGCCQEPGGLSRELLTGISEHDRGPVIHIDELPIRILNEDGLPDRIEEIVITDYALPEYLLEIELLSPGPACSVPGRS